MKKIRISIIILCGVLGMALPLQGMPETVQSELRQRRRSDTDNQGVIIKSSAAEHQLMEGERELSHSRELLVRTVHSQIERDPTIMGILTVLRKKDDEMRRIQSAQQWLLFSQEILTVSVVQNKIFIQHLPPDRTVPRNVEKCQLQHALEELMEMPSQKKKNKLNNEVIWWVHNATMQERPMLTTVLKGMIECETEAIKQMHSQEEVLRQQLEEMVHQQAKAVEEKASLLYESDPVLQEMQQQIRKRQAAVKKFQ